MYVTFKWFTRVAGVVSRGKRVAQLEDEEDGYFWSDEISSRDPSPGYGTQRDGVTFTKHDVEFVQDRGCVSSREDGLGFGD